MILMQQNFNNLQFLVGTQNILEELKTVPALPIFAPRMTEFFSALSNVILKDRRARNFAHVTAYAYWIRRASLEREKNMRNDFIDSRLGRGVAFHIAPSNVPLAFAMSLTVAAMAGNASCVRLSSREFAEVEIICDAMNELLDTGFKDLKNYFLLVRYPHDERITEFFSELCDVRIIWGGDNTINTIRQIPLPPRSVEFTFADRHSVALIQSEKYLESNAQDVAKKFYADTYDMDQNACSSPRAVIWTGNATDEAREKFWASLEKIVHADYEMQPIQAVDKFSAACMLGMKNSGVKLISTDNFVTRVEVDALKSSCMDFKPGGGCFIEYIAKDWSEIIPLLNKQCQTVAVLGINLQDFRKWVISKGLRGVDRIVPFGETTALAFMWDGFDLINGMSRYIEV